MKFSEQVITKRWKPILEEYEKILSKVNPRSFEFVKDLCQAHHISTKELRRYYHKWLEGNKQDESLLPHKRGARPGSRRTPKDIERNIVKAYRRFGSNRYELVLLFKPYYLDKTPSPATMDRIKARYPLNEQDKQIIKRYEKQSPGELAHIDITKIPKDIRCSFKIKELYAGAVCDDCTRLIYAEVLKDKKASTLTYFMFRALSWFKQIYNFEYEAIMSDDGPEFKGSLIKEHPFETMCNELGIKHICTRPYRPQTNGKIEAFWKILKNEFFYPNSFNSKEDLIMNLGNFLFEYNHLRRHGGLNYETPFDKLQKVTELLS
ncbi:MAG: integrase core domain-containing protein [Candidatus Omnitrophota bacterium]|nr:DDE-type integrase/transposase/recombinase [Candidatus Omnitrophota bacterium]MBU1928338.1 DDE-type integrase/transposase/recombinase [Candidatus Omnitrophota bacterium]MBU2034345.1 DDE-type integrase/transposase/recombinase [Candidatus Omnitrophota bacterium]MBU2222340.1 DDE-type integrase/transposase/recombinase [Candidatus Omnitrophota bacterium]MBU2258452.1 DDE-type integrase/transposase/recombinase [Candidatus Omnitrophota bacterium]